MFLSRHQNPVEWLSTRQNPSSTRQFCRSLAGFSARGMVSQAPFNFILINGLWKKRQAQKHNAMGGCWSGERTSKQSSSGFSPINLYFSSPPSSPPAGIHHRSKQNPNIYQFASRGYPCYASRLQGKPVRKWILRIECQWLSYFQSFSSPIWHPGSGLPLYITCSQILFCLLS